METYDFDQIKESYRKSGKRLFLLDYEGTLIPNTFGGVDAGDFADVSELLFLLSEDTNNDVILISSQKREDLEDSFAYLPVTLVAENGGFYRQARGEWQTISANSLSWKENAYKALTTMSKQYPGTSVEVKHYSIAWNYNSAIHKISEGEKRQLMVAIRSLGNKHEVAINDDGKQIEFTSTIVSKSKFAAYWVVRHSSYDFILAIGSDASDEDLFDTVGPSYFTIKVGAQLNSSARFTIGTQEEVLPFLDKLTK
jgi:trehalose 6-phosphate synthase/phosphatase